MKFIKRYLQNLIREAILNTDRPPLVVEIRTKGIKMDNINISVKNCLLNASSAHPCFTVVPIEIEDRSTEEINLHEEHWHKD